VTGSTDIPELKELDFRPIEIGQGKAGVGIDVLADWIYDSGSSEDPHQSN
jgi:hypothetical protein